MSELMDKLRAARDDLNADKDWTDQHAYATISFGELIESGFDWGAKEYGSDMREFTDEMRAHINRLVVERYRLREICDIPARFKSFLVANLDIALTRWIIPYKLLWDNKLILTRETTVNGRERIVDSDYPAAQIKGDNDYANAARDRAYGSTVDGSPLKALIETIEKLESIEEQIIKSVEKCFYSHFPAYYKDPFCHL